MKRTQSMRIGGVVASLLLAVCAALAGEDGGHELLEPFLTRSQYGALLREVDLDADQRLVTEVLYGDYAAAVEDLLEQTRQRMEKAGWSRMQAALRGDLVIEPDELRRLRVAVLDAQRQSWPQADRQLDELLENTRSLLTTDVTGSFDRARREVRRALFLHPRRRAEQDDTYAGDGVDVAELVAAALRPDGELADVPRDRVDAVLESYRGAFDRQIAGEAAADRAARMRRAIARIERDETALRDERGAALARWSRLHRLNRETVDALAAIAGEHAGHEAEDRWRARFDEACFPWLFHPSRPQRQHGWITRHAVGEDVRRQADAIAAEYARAQAGLRRQAIELILRGRIDAHAIVHARMDPTGLGDPRIRDLYQGLLRNSGRRASLDAQTSARLEALLDDRQQKRMNADLMSRAARRVR